MKQPTMVMRVRFKSALPSEEVMMIAQERVPEFAALFCDCCSQSKEEGYFCRSW